MNPLSDVEILCIQADIMYDTQKEATKHVCDNGHKMGVRTFQRHLKKIDEKSTTRLFEMAKGAKEGQMQIIDELETVKGEYWKIYRGSNIETIEKIRTLREIREIIPHITAAKAAIPHVIKEVIQNFQKTGTEPRAGRSPSIITK